MFYKIGFTWSGAKELTITHMWRGLYYVIGLQLCGIYIEINYKGGTVLSSCMFLFCPIDPRCKILPLSDVQ